MTDDKSGVRGGENLSADRRIIQPEIKGSQFTLVQAIAWIAFRDIEGVTFSTDIVDLAHRCEGDEVERARQELWTKLAQGAVFADGFAVGEDQRVVIPAVEWKSLLLNPTPGDGCFPEVFCPAGSGYQGVFISRDAIIKVWPPTRVVGSRRGRPPAPYWPDVEAEVMRLMDIHDEFGPDDPDWDCQAKLEKAIADFIAKQHGAYPAESTIRGHVVAALQTAMSSPRFEEKKRNQGR